MSGWKGELGLLLTVLLLSGREAGIRIGRRGKRREGRPDFGGGAGKRKGRSKEANGVGGEEIVVHGLMRGRNGRWEARRRPTS
jgi:hypothetical protein